MTRRLHGQKDSLVKVVRAAPVPAPYNDEIVFGIDPGGVRSSAQCSKAGAWHVRPRLASAKHFIDAEEIADTDGIVIHPSFRVVALASMTKELQSAWLSRDVIDSLSTLFLPTPSEE